MQEAILFTCYNKRRNRKLLTYSLLHRNWMIESGSRLNQPPTATLQSAAIWQRHPHWVALGLYKVLTVVITFPLTFQLGSHLQGGLPTSDSYQNIWYMWWYGRALEQGLDPSRSSLMYGLLPDVQVLISSVINGLLMWPVIKLFGALAAYNIAILLSFALAGFFAYRLADEALAGRNRQAAFAAGFFFTFSTYHFYRAGGHLGLVTIQWIPFYLWRLFCLQRQPGLRNALLASLGLILAALSDLYYLGYFVLLVTLLFLAWVGITERRTVWKWYNQRWYILTLVVGVVGLVPFYSFFLNLDPDLRRSISERAGDVREFSADLLAFVFPTGRNPFYGALTAPIYSTFKTSYSIEQAVFPGYIVLGLSLIAPFLKTIRNRWAAFCALMVGVAFVLALGPRLHIGGQEIGPTMPYGFIYGKLPLLGTFRAPNRFGIVVLLGLAVLAAFTLSWLLEKLNGRIKRPVAWVGLALVLVLALSETLTFSYPMTLIAVEIPQVYRQIAAEPGDFLVLELPLDTRSQPLYYQTLHQKRLVGGVATRISNRMTLSWDRATYLGMFNPAESSAVINNGQPLKIVGGPDIFPLDLTFRQMLTEQKIGYVIVRTNRPAFAWIYDYVREQLGLPTSEEMVQGERLLAWRLLPLAPSAPPPVAVGNYRIRLGEGWNAGLGKSDNGQLLRLAEQDARLLVTPGTPGPTNLTLLLTPYIRPQSIEVRLNGQPIGRVEGREPWKPLVIQLPLTLVAGPNVIELHSVEGCLQPIDYIPGSPDVRCISFAVQNVNLTATPPS